MMSYAMFKEIVKEQIKDYLPERFKDSKIVFDEVLKVNRSMDAICLASPNKGSYVTSPSVYINNMFENYKKCNDLKAVIQNAADTLVHAMEKVPELDSKVEFKKAEKNIVFTLINTEQNKELLSKIPHRPFNDLSIIYRWLISKEDNAYMSSIVNNQMAEMLGMNENELYVAAKKNTEELLPPTVTSMQDVINKIMFGDNELSDEFMDICDLDVPDENMMYILSNSAGINGASAILYDEPLSKLSDAFGSDLYLLPSSIHETIAVSANMGNPEELAEMVNSINMDQVALEERLSNQVYYYDRQTREITMATDTPNKRIDGGKPIVAFEAIEERR